MLSVLARHKSTIQGLKKKRFYCSHSNNCYNNCVVVVQEDVLSILAKHLDESALQTRSFLVDVSGTSIDEEHISEQVQISNSSLTYVFPLLSSFIFYCFSERIWCSISTFFLR